MADKKDTKILEREYVIPIRNKINHVSRVKRTPKAIKVVKQFLARHMTIRDRDLDKIKISRYLNEALWFRGIRNPPYKIKVKAIKEKEGDEEIVKVDLAEYPERMKFKKAREEKERKAGEKESKKAEKKEEKSEAKKDETAENKKLEEEKEKKSAVVEAEEKEEKKEHKEAKHETKDDSKEPKHKFRQALEK